MSGGKRVRLLIAYDGAGYHGWQSGRSGRGVADCLQRVLAGVGVQGDLVSSSRTDSGVHAFGLVAHADIAGPWVAKDAGRLRDFLNAGLPASIRVREAKWVSERFDARYGARWKEYRYSIWNEPVMNPLLAGRAWHVARPLDLTAIRQAAKQLIGRHDFHAFTSRRDGELGDPVRELQKLMISRKGGEVKVIIRADGFLYKMCRGIVGTLVEVGCGNRSAEEVGAFLLADAPRTSAVNAPAHGLTLWKVGYR